MHACGIQRSYPARGPEVHGLHVSHLKFPRATDEKISFPQF